MPTPENHLYGYTYNRSVQYVSCCSCKDAVLSLSNTQQRYVDVCELVYNLLFSRIIVVALVRFRFFFFFLLSLKINVRVCYI